ncbi:MAG: DUF1015 domain-containing protein [Planctomycetes bacterium]|nr:DUF1015 domain-containing protein [Planctomycetota bacterium]
MEIRPFRAYRFAPDVVGNSGDCIAPPYDVIGPELQETLYQRNEYNIVRVIKGKTQADDDDSNNQYTRAAKALTSWIESGALKQDQEEAIYAYVQDFELAGTRRTRLSFIALGKIEAFGKTVKPHEEILKKPMQDRLNLKRATHGRFGLIYLLYRDEQGVAEKAIEKAMTADPLVDFTDLQDVRHRLYAIGSRTDQAAIVDMMADKSCIIADGHHRYTTGIQFAKELNTPAAQYQMAAFANTCQEGLVILATHRLVDNVEAFDTGRLIASLDADFSLTQWPFQDPDGKQKALQAMLAEMKSRFDQGQSAFGIYTGKGTFYAVTLTDRRSMKAVAAEKSDAWCELDVSILHKLILERSLGIDADKLAQGGYVTYVKDTPSAIDESIARVDQGEEQAAFFTNPVRIEQLVAVTDTGERMPQKSTYFYPKMFTGLTIQKL